MAIVLRRAVSVSEREKERKKRGKEKRKLISLISMKFQVGALRELH